MLQDVLRGIATAANSLIIGTPRDSDAAATVTPSGSGAGRVLCFLGPAWLEPPLFAVIAGAPFVSIADAGIERGDAR